MKKLIMITLIVLYLFNVSGCASTEVVETKQKTSDAVEKYNEAIKERAPIVEE